MMDDALKQGLAHRMAELIPGVDLASTRRFPKFAS